MRLPLHPEYRTMPMVWYIPPLSPIMNTIEGKGSNADWYDIFPAIDEMRIPIEYLANLLTAGDTNHIRSSFEKNGSHEKLYACSNNRAIL